VVVLGALEDGEFVFALNKLIVGPVIGTLVGASVLLIGAVVVGLTEGFFCWLLRRWTSWGILVFNSIYSQINT